MATYEGRRLEVLVDGPSPEPTFCSRDGHAGQAPEIDGTTYINDGSARAGDLVEVEITETFDYDIVGHITRVIHPAPVDGPSSFRGPKLTKSPGAARRVELNHEDSPGDLEWHRAVRRDDLLDFDQVRPRASRRRHQRSPRRLGSCFRLRLRRAVHPARLAMAILLRPVKTVSAWRCFEVFTIGFMANNVLPARLGDVARAYVLARQEKLPAASSFSSVMLERIFDGVTVVLFLNIVLFVQPTDDAWINYVRVLSGAVFVGAIGYVA